MHTPLIVLFIIAFNMLSVEILTFAHILWIEPKGSVLDAYDEHSAAPQREDLASLSIGELLTRYEQARGEVRDFEAKKLPKSSCQEEETCEPYRKANILKNAIEQKESERRHIRRISFHWGSGFVLLCVGLLCFHRVNPWLGLACIVAAFVQMIFSVVLDGWRERDFRTLVIIKIWLSILSMALLIAAGYLTKALLEEGEMGAEGGGE